jgi:hypothetical protein
MNTSNIALNILSNASKDDGQGIHRSGSILAKAYEDAKSGSFSIEKTETGYSVNGAEFSLNAAIVAAFLGAYDNKQDVSINKLVEYYNADVVGQAQFKLLGKDIKDSGNSPAQQAKRLLTAEEYLANVISAAAIDTVHLYDQLKTFGDKNTKAELLDFVNSLKLVLVPEDKAAVYNVMVEKEGSLNKLKEYGFTDFTRYSGVTGTDTFQATISVDYWRNAKGKLTELFTFVAAVNKEVDEFQLPVTLRVTFSAKSE